MKMLLLRHNLQPGYTEGLMLLDGRFYAHTLEDTVRPLGEKIAGQTAIPAGTYDVMVEMSPRLQKPLPRLLNVPEFDGVLIHGGNTTADTLGCILIATNRTAPGIIQGSLSLDLTMRLQNDPGPHSIEIIDVKV